MANRVFKESQKFNQPWVWLIIVTSYILVHFWGIQDLLRGHAYDSEPFIGALVGIVLMNLLVLLFATMKLETRIDLRGIHFRYRPLIHSWRSIHWEEMKSVEVKSYSPWLYGGWGIRLSLLGWAYNVRGNKGIVIKKKNGRRLLIGTQIPEAAQNAIHQLMNEEKVNHA
ncbi:MAG TPA: hypothetical protein VK014_07265 [Cyclobacteriaceae bacterium]|nr:hypothetical protein [Cyclobacteriaceae bacterium]